MENKVNGKQSQWRTKSYMENKVNGKLGHMVNKVIWKTMSKKNKVYGKQSLWKTKSIENKV